MYSDPLEARLLAEEHTKDLLQDAEQGRLMQAAKDTRKERKRRLAVKSVLGSLLRHMIQH